MNRQTNGTFAPVGNRCHAVIVVSGLILLSGCWQPIPGGEPARRQGSREARRQEGRTPPAGDVQIRIAGETLDPATVWNRVRDDALERRKPNGEEFRAFVEHESVSWVTNAVAESLLYQRAALRLAPEGDDELNRIIDAQLRKIITAEHGGVQWRFERHLASRGQTLDDVRRALRRELVVARYLETEVRPKVIEPTRAELVALYQADGQEWNRPQRRSMSLIDIRVLDQLPAGVAEPTREQLAQAKEAARNKIEAARRELAQGHEFGDVARRYSEGLHAAEGGSWGWITKESVRERFEPAVDALYALRPGETSDILETPYGFFLVRCDAAEGVAGRDFESVQPDLKEQHFRKEYNRLIADLLSELQSRAQVRMEELDRFRARLVELALGDFTDGEPSLQ